MARMLSLQKDKNDDTQLRHGYERHEGTDVGDITANGTYMFGQVCPYFFTREGNTMFLDGMYRGSTCFLIGGGPSLLKEDYLKLHNPGILTFGMNNSSKLIRPNMWSSVDDPSRFIYSTWIDPKIMKFIPQAAFTKPLWKSTFVDGKQMWEEASIKVGDCPNVVGFRRNEKFQPHRFLTEDTINWGCHKKYGGCRSVMLSSLRIMFILGIRRVFLVGVDLKMDTEHKYSFNEGRTKGAIKNNNSTYKRMLTEYFPALKPEFDKWGFEVYCCNKESDVCKTFPHVSFEDAIKTASGELGDVDKEKTEGMYLKLEEKRKRGDWENCAKATEAIK